MPATDKLAPTSRYIQTSWLHRCLWPLETSPTISTCTQTFATTLFVDHARFGCTFFSFAAAAANLDQVTHDEIEVSSEESCTRLYQLFCLCTPVGSKELLVVVDIIPKTCEHYLVSFPSKMTQRNCFAFWEWTMVPNSSWPLVVQTHFCDVQAFQHQNAFALSGNLLHRPVPSSLGSLT